MTTFEALNLRQTTMNAIRALKFETPTPVQAKAIPELMAGRDLIAQARTGTGKTAAFGIPLVEGLSELETYGVVGLVLVPTRELALQVAEQLVALARGTHLRVVAVYGGVGFEEQRRAVGARDPILLVATPGRLLDHVSRRTVRLDDVRALVLDEADRMLDMGFLPDVERIVSLTPRQRQTALFSATLPEPIRRLSSQFLRHPVQLRIEEGPAAQPQAEHFRVDLQRSQKAQGLLALLQKEAPERSIVFTRTKHLARRLARQLHGAGHRAVALQGNMTQSQRERALDSFRDGASKILVATDIASRGLDVPEISHIVNYDVPLEPDVYVHRAGRTARMGRSGRSFTFVQGDQQRELAAIERAAGLRLERFELGELPPAPAEPARDPADGLASRARHEGRPFRRGGERRGPARFGSSGPRWRDAAPARTSGRTPWRRSGMDNGNPGK